MGAAVPEAAAPPFSLGTLQDTLADNRLILRARTPGSTKPSRGNYGRIREPSFYRFNSHSETVRIHFSICLFESASHMVYDL